MSTPFDRLVEDIQRNLSAGQRKAQIVGAIVSALLGQSLAGHQRVAQAVGNLAKGNAPGETSEEARKIPSRSKIGALAAVARRRSPTGDTVVVGRSHRHRIPHPHRAGRVLKRKDAPAQQRRRRGRIARANVGRDDRRDGPRIGRIDNHLRKVEHIENVLQLQLRQNECRPRAVHPIKHGAAPGGAIIGTVWQCAVGGMIVVHRQADLLQVVAALHPPRRFPCRLHRRQQQRDQDADDRDDDQQLDQRKRARFPIAEFRFRIHTHVMAQLPTICNLQLFPFLPHISQQAGCGNSEQYHRTRFGHGRDPIIPDGGHQIAARLVRMHVMDALHVG